MIYNYLERLKPYIRPYFRYYASSLFFSWTIYQKLLNWSDKPKVTPFGFKFSGNRAMQTGMYEREIVEAFISYAQNIDVVVDVGANIGLYTCVARSLGKYVLSIEPLPQNLSYLYHNLRANSWHDVEVFPVAISEKPGMLELYGTSEWASLVRGWGGSPLFLHRTVAISTLDVLLKYRFAGKKLMIKIDVEGSEFLAIQGAQSILAMQPKPIWLVEILFEHLASGVNPNFLSTFDMFWNNDYCALTADDEGRTITKDEVLGWVNSTPQRLPPSNYIFVPNPRIIT